MFRFNYGRIVPNLAIAFCLAAAHPARATDRNWLTTGNGFFSDPTKWTGSVIPGTTDRAIFNQDSNHTIVFVTNPTNDRLRVNNDSVTLSLAGETYRLTSNTNSSISVGGSLPLHGQPAAVGTLTIAGGTLNSVSTDIGISTTGSGTIIASTNATWNNSALLNVGMGTNGTLTIQNNADVTALIVTVGYESPGFATVTGTGSTLTATSHLDVGGNDAGTLSILAAGKVTTPSASIGPAPVSTGTATVSGSSSRWDQTSYFKVGEYGTATLNVAAGGVINNTSLTQDSTIGDQSGSHGTVTVDNATWNIQSRNLLCGYSGGATLTIQNAGHVSAFSGEVALSSAGVASANVTVTGSNSYLAAKSLHVAGSSTGSGGPATLSIANGGRVDVGFSNTLKLWPNGTIHLNPGGTINTGAMSIVSGGLFDWTGGELNLTNMVLNIGPGGLLGSSPSIGTTKTLSVANVINVGAGGNSSLAVNAGGTVNSYGGIVGPAAGPIASVTIDGPGSIWNNYSTFVVGANGNGSLTITNNGDFETVGPDSLTPSAIIGDQPASIGTVSVSGPGSVLNAYHNLATPGEFIVGNYGTGQLNLSNNAIVAHTASDAIVGKYADSHGTVNVTGPFSRWRTDTYNIILGQYGTADLSVTAGGIVENPSGHSALGYQPGGVGTAIVDGQNSTWSAAAMTIGDGGTGHLTIQNGGAVSATEIYLGLFPGASGDVTVDGPGSSILATTGFGYLIPGSASNGSLTVRNGALAHCIESFIGDGSTATGSLLVTGPNSRFIADDEFDVGFSGNGTLELHNGAFASTEVATIGYGNGSTGLAVVDGAGTSLAISDRLELGGGASGRLTVAAAGSVSVTNAIGVYSTGTLDLAGGSVSAANIDILGGAITGDGSISAPIANAGTVSPGHSAGTITVIANYSQSPAGALNVELAGLAPSQFDRLSVSGTATLAGTLYVSLINGFVPAAGNAFPIVSATSLTGTFTTVSLVNFPQGSQVTIDYTPTTASVRIVAIPTQCSTCPGDLNADARVDGRDLQAFLACLVSSAGACACADLNADNQVTPTDVPALVTRLLSSSPCQ